MSTRAVTWWTDGIRSEWTLTVRPSKETPPPAAHPLADLDDRALVDASLAGRTEAFDAIVQRHQQAVYRLCYRFARSREDAMDLSQDVFLRAYRGLGRFRGDSAFSTWLYRISVNVCLNRASIRSVPETPLDEAAHAAAGGTDAAASLERRQERGRVRAAIAKLPAKQRATIILRVYHDLSHEDIASVLGTSVGASKANLFHALGNLKRILAAPR